MQEFERVIQIPAFFSIFKNVKTLSISNIVGGLLFAHSNKYE